MQQLARKTPYEQEETLIRSAKKLHNDPVSGETLENGNLIIIFCKVIISKGDFK